MNLPENKTKINCCGCALCKEICPKNAIQMKSDQYGYVYPDIDNTKCIHCGLCSRKCSYKNIEKRKYQSISYAGTNTNEEQKLKSTSAGIFSALATRTIELGGCVYGASMQFLKNNSVEVKHIGIDSIEDLEKLQGSKYVQSDISCVLHNIKKQLINGKLVLFSGTPCQVAAIKEITGNPSNLITVDLICHGVPSCKFLQDYLISFEKKQKDKLVDFKFRDKSQGWDLDGILIGKKDNYKFSPIDSSYYRLFLDCEIFRENCYQCPFANDKRIGDITIGDYWGIQEYSPELLSENGGFIKAETGASCILENTEKGRDYLNNCGDLIRKQIVDIDKLKKRNTQLVHPAVYTKLRDRILRAYEKKGYDGVEKKFYRWLLCDKIKKKFKILIKKII